MLPLLKTDFGEVCKAVIDKNINDTNLEWDKCAVAVVAASGGYPESYEKGCEMFIPELELADEFIYYAGVNEKDNKMITNGGRVLMAVAVKKSHEEARVKSYEIIKKISFDKMQYRTDIAKNVR